MVVAEWKRSINMRSAHVCGSIAMHSTEMNFDGIRFALRQTHVVCYASVTNS